MHVDHILKSKGSAVHTVTAETGIGDAVSVLNTRKIGAAVVIDDAGAVVGILSERDIVRHLGDNPATLLALRVSDCMTKTVITANRATTVAELMNQMTKFRIRHIPIVENGALVGIVSIGDVVKRKIEEAETEAAALRDYIAS